MTFKIKGEDAQIKFTFNSFRFLKDFDLSVIDVLETKPFMAIPLTEALLLGGLNWTPNKVYNIKDVDTALEEFVEDGNLAVLIEDLMTELQASPFFKSLQMGKPEE